MDHCIICGQKTGLVIFRERGINVYRCTGCGHVYSGHDPGTDYDGYFPDNIRRADHFWWAGAHRRMYGAFGRRFLAGRGGRLLDAGCGLGYFLEFSGKYPGWELYGREVSGPAVDFAVRELCLSSVTRGRIEDSDYPPGYFDIITLWDVIEHLPEPHGLLRHLQSRLKHRGLLFIHTPNINIQLPKARLKKFLSGKKENPHLLEARDHINIYSPRTIRRLLKDCGYGNIEFIHLPPIQSAAGSRSVLAKTAKNAWYFAARGLAAASGGRVNIDNLFVVARRGRKQTAGIKPKDI